MKEHQAVRCNYRPPVSVYTDIQYCGDVQFQVERLGKEAFRTFEIGRYPLHFNLFRPHRLHLGLRHHHGLHNSDGRGGVRRDVRDDTYHGHRIRGYVRAS